MKKLRKVIASDTLVIILSVMMGILLWLSGYNTSNPTEPKEYKLQVELRNVDKLAETGKFLQNRDALDGREVVIRINTSRNVHRELNEARNQGLITAYIDFGVSHLLHADPSNNRIVTSVEIDYPNKYRDPDYAVDIISRDPLTLTVEFDRIVERTLPVIANTTKWDSDRPENFEYTNPEFYPWQVTVSGPSMDINRISRIEVLLDAPSVDITAPGAPDEYVVTFPPRAVDNLGAIIENKNVIFKDVDLIEVSYNIRKIKELPIISPELINDPAPGYALSPIGPNLEYSPQTIFIKGPKDDVDAAVNIRLSPIDISGMTDESKLAPISLRNYLSEISPKLEFVDINSAEVEVKLKIERTITEEYDFYTSRLQVEPINYDASIIQIPSVPLNIEVRSVKSLMESFSLYDMVTASIDITNFVNISPGEYEVPVSMSVAEGYELLTGEQSITITIREVPLEENNSDTIDHFPEYIEPEYIESEGNIDFDDESTDDELTNGDSTDEQVEGINNDDLDLNNDPNNDLTDNLNDDLAGESEIINADEIDEESDENEEDDNIVITAEQDDE